METVYIETTIVSYLVAKPSTDPILAAHQSLTIQWWQTERARYQCVTSEEVLREAALGDPTKSRLRLAALAELAVLAIDRSARDLAREMIAEKILPPIAASDAIHAAVAAQRNIKILLTWNCRHLANPHLLSKLRLFIGRRELTLPEICTPVELMGE